MNQNSSAKTIKEPLYKRILSILGWVLIGLLLVMDIISLTLRFSTKGGRTKVFGNEIRIVMTGSMEGSKDFYKEHPDYQVRDLPVHSAVIIEDVPLKEDQAKTFYSSLKEGDVLTFYYGGTCITHRIIDIDLDSEGIYTYTMRGDNPTGDKVVSENSPTQICKSNTGLIVGKVKRGSVFWGWYITYMVNNRMVLLLTVIVPCFLLMIYEIVKAVFAAKNLKEEEKDQKQEAENQKKDEELLRLRKQVAELEGKKKEEQPK